jgi:prepilin-type N-terminal cleavage/methylation domain-containing protein
MKGYTLLEIIIVIGLSALFSAFALGYTTATKNQVAMSIEATKITQVIVRAKGLTIATYATIPGTCGYGVALDQAQNSFSLFAYTPAGAPPCPSILSVAPSARKMVDQGSWNVPLARGAKLISGSDNLVLVLFSPPAPTTFISRDNGATFINQTSRVYLSTVDGSASTSIIVNPGGQVSF